MLIKEFKNANDGRRLYTLRAVEIVKPASKREHANTGETGSTYSPPAGFEEKLSALAAAVNAGPASGPVPFARRAPADSPPPPGASPAEAGRREPRTFATADEALAYLAKHYSRSPAEIEASFGFEKPNDAIAAANTLAREIGAMQDARPPAPGGASAEQLAQDEQAAAHWRQLAADPAAFAFGQSAAQAANEVAQDLSTPESPLRALEDRAGKEVVFLAPEGQLLLTERAPGIWEADASAAWPNGAQLYQAAFTWAHNNGHVVEGYELTPINDLRRTSNMLSSALRHGTTRHLVPADTQAVAWRKGDDAANLGALARREADLVLQKIPQAAEWSYDLDRGTTLDASGLPVDSERVQRTLAETGGGSRQHGVGLATLARALLSRSLDGRPAADVRTALARLAEEKRTPRVLYARRGRGVAGGGEGIGVDDPPAGAARPAQTPAQLQARFEQLRADFDWTTAEAEQIRAEMQPLPYGVAVRVRSRAPSFAKAERRGRMPCEAGAKQGGT